MRQCGVGTYLHRQKGVTLNVPAIVLAGTLKMYQQVAVINVNEKSQ